MPAPSPISTRNSCRTIPKKRSILPRPSGPAGCAVGDLDAQPGGGPLQRRIDKSRAVINVYRGPGRRGRPAPGAARRPAARCPRSSPSGRPSPPGSGRRGRRTGTPCGPAIRGPCSASPVHSSFGRDASNRPKTAGGRPSGRVVSSSRSKCRCSVRTDGDQPHDCPQDPQHLRGGAGRVLPLQPGGQLQHRRVGARGDLPGRRGQRGEPAGPPGPDPPVDRLPRHGHRVAERPRVRPGRPARGPAGPAAGWTAPGQRPPGSAGTGTTPPARPGPPACGPPQPLT